MALDLNLKDGDVAVERLLNFLRFSFGGGTDVDKPLQLSLDRLQHDEWKQVRYRNMSPNKASLDLPMASTVLAC